MKSCHSNVNFSEDGSATNGGPSVNDAKEGAGGGGGGGGGGGAGSDQSAAAQAGNSGGGAAADQRARTAAAKQKGSATWKMVSVPLFAVVTHRGLSMRVRAHSPASLADVYGVETGALLGGVFGLPFLQAIYVYIYCS